MKKIGFIDCPSNIIYPSKHFDIEMKDEAYERLLKDLYDDKRINLNDYFDCPRGLHATGEVNFSATENIEYEEVWNRKIRNYGRKNMRYGYIDLCIMNHFGYSTSICLDEDIKWDIYTKIYGEE